MQKFRICLCLICTLVFWPQLSLPASAGDGGLQQCYKAEFNTYRFYTDGTELRRLFLLATQAIWKQAPARTGRAPDRMGILTQISIFPSEMPFSTGIAIPRKAIKAAITWDISIFGG